MQHCTHHLALRHELTASEPHLRIVEMQDVTETLVKVIESLAAGTAVQRGATLA